MLNGQGFDVYFHINLNNNLNLTFEADGSTNLDTGKDSDKYLGVVEKNTKVDQADHNRSFFDILGKDPNDFRKIKPVHLKKIKVIKDPVDVHHNVYIIEFINIDNLLLEYVKSGVLDYLIIRIGDLSDVKLKDANTNSGKNPYDRMRLFLKPVKIDTPKTNNKKVTDFTLQCVSLTTYAMLYDKSFYGEIDGGINDNTVSVIGTTDVSANSSEEAVNFKPIENFSSLNEMFQLVSTKTGVPINILQGFAVIESGMNPNSGNGTSSAKGLYQFIDSTWRTMLQNHGSKYGLSSNTSVFDPSANTLMAAELLKSNQKLLKDLGQEASISNLYLAHFLGENDLKKIMNANPNTPAADLLRRMTSSGIMHDPGNSNKSIFYKNGRPITAGELISWAKQLTNTKLGSYAPLDIDNESFGYGDFDLPNEAITTINSRLESFKNTTGKNFLKQVLHKLKLKYSVNNLGYNDSISPKSDYMYQVISAPTLNIIRLLEYFHDNYSPYMITVPWIFDDAHTNRDDTNRTNLGYTYYKEVNILNPEILKPRNLVKDSLISGNHIKYNITDAVRYYPKEIAHYYKSSNFTFTDPFGTVTNIKSLNDGSRMLIPKDNGSGDIILDSVNIESAENIVINGNYDAVEFSKRLDYLFKHINADPSLLKVTIFGDYPAYIDFGYAYMLYSDHKSSMIGTPFKIVQTFEHKENGLVLTTDVIMYVANDIQ